MRKEKSRVAILGCGGIANGHASNLAGLKNAQLVAFCDIVEERARRFSAEYSEGKGKVFTDHRRMYDEVPMDAVYVCLPPFAHTDEVELAAGKGIHVFIEKPIALDMETAERMVQAVNRHKVKAQVGFLSRFGEAVEQVKSGLEDGSFGEPGLLAGKYYCNSLHGPWWRDKSKSGGQVVEQILHLFDLTRHFLGKVETVYCRMANLFHREVEGYTAEDVSGTVVGFADGAIGVIAATNCGIPGQWLYPFSLFAKNATVDFANPNNATIHHTGHQWAATTAVSSEKNLLLAETLDFLEAVEQDRPTRVPIEEGVKSLELVLAASRSAETGEVVRLSHP